MPEHLYQVAGLRFRLALPPEDPLGARLASYAPFGCEAEAGGPLLFSLRITGGDERLPEPEEGEAVARFEDDTAVIELWRRSDGSHGIRIAPPGRDGGAFLQVDAERREALVRLEGGEAERFFGLDNSLMLLYMLASATRNTLLMHASVVVADNRACLFLGKSGTGKSTHTRLWLQHIPGSRLLNDDNPVVRLEGDGTVRAYGSPWSGKTPCYLNESAPVGGFVRLRQAPENRIAANGPARAFAALLPSCSGAPWDKTAQRAIQETLAQIAARVPVYTLECLPDGAAAELCHATLAGKMP